MRTSGPLGPCVCDRDQRKGMGNMVSPTGCCWEVLQQGLFGSLSPGHKIQMWLFFTCSSSGWFRVVAMAKGAALALPLVWVGFIHISHCQGQGVLKFCFLIFCICYQRCGVVKTSNFVYRGASPRKLSSELVCFYGFLFSFSMS